MARQAKAVVDYFPHTIERSRSLKILVKTFQEKGYMFWYELLGLLGKTENHYFDIQELDKFEDFYTDCFLDPISVGEILNKCASLGMIDKELWEKGIIYSENFVEGIKDAYRKRKTELLEKNEIIAFLVQSGRINGISSAINSINSAINQQSKVKEIKEKESRVEEIKKDENFSTPTTPTFSNSHDDNIEDFKDDLKNWHGEYSNVRLTSLQYQNLLALTLSEKLLGEFIADLSSNIEQGSEKRYREDLPNVHFERLKAYIAWRKTHPNKPTGKNNQNGNKFVGSTSKPIRNEFLEKKRELGKPTFEIPKEAADRVAKMKAEKYGIGG